MLNRLYFNYFKDRFANFYWTVVKYHCNHLDKVINSTNDLSSINLVLKSMNCEEMNYFPVKDIVQFERCIKKGQISFEYPKGGTIIDRLTMSLFIKHLAHCFLVMDIYKVADLLERDVVEKYLRIDFNLTYYEFKALWNSLPNEYRQFIERAAQFYFDAFYCVKLQRFPICSLYTKWVLGDQCSVEDKNYSSFKSIVLK